MSDKNEDKKEVTKPNPLAPVSEIPEKAPIMPFDIEKPDLSILDVFPDNYFSMEGLQNILDFTQAAGLGLTVTACTIECVYDPAKDEDGRSGKWTPVLSFAETGTRLVLNKTRARAAWDVSGSPLVKDWAGLGQVMIRPGIRDGHAQILLERARANGNPPRSVGGRKAETSSQDDIFAE